MIADKIRAAFDEKCQRNTRPRRIIAQRLVELAANGADFTADDLWQELRQVEPKLGRATLYRSLEMLVGEGLLDRVDFADGTHHYRVCGGKPSPSLDLHTMLSRRGGGCLPACRPVRRDR